MKSFAQLNRRGNLLNEILFNGGAFLPCHSVEVGSECAALKTKFNYHRLFLAPGFVLHTKLWTSSKDLCELLLSFMKQWTRLQWMQLKVHVRAIAWCFLTTLSAQLSLLFCFCSISRWLSEIICVTAFLIIAAWEASTWGLSTLNRRINWYLKFFLHQNMSINVGKAWGHKAGGEADDFHLLWPFCESNREHVEASTALNQALPSHKAE